MGFVVEILDKWRKIMGKKKLRAKYTSKGTARAMDWAITKAMRADKSELDKAIDKLDALAAGKNPWTTIPNPNPEETNKRFIRVPLKQDSISVRKEKDFILANGE